MLLMQCECMYVSVQTEKNPEAAVSALQGMVEVQVRVINTHTCGKDWPDQRPLILISKE